MSEQLGPYLIGLAGGVALLSYWLKLRGLSHHERMAEIERGIHRVSPFALRFLPLWFGALLGLGAVGYAGYSYSANLGPEGIRMIFMGSRDRAGGGSVQFTATYSLVWQCQWSYDTGTSDDAILGRLDTGAEAGLSECFSQTVTSNAGTMTVVAAPTSGYCANVFPGGVTNVLQTLVQTGSDGVLVEADSVIAIPSVGEYIYARQLFCLQGEPGESHNKHFLHWGTGSWYAGGGCTGGGTGSGCYGFRWFLNGATLASDTTFSLDGGPMFASGTTDVGRGQGNFSIPDGTLKANRLLVIEERFHRFHADSVKIDVRVSEADGTVVATSADFGCTISGNTTTGCYQSGAGVGDPIGTYGLYIQDWRRFVGFEIGNNGGGGPAAARYIFFGANAIRVSTSSDDWIGLYPAGGEN